MLHIVILIVLLLIDMGLDGVQLDHVFKLVVITALVSIGTELRNKQDAE